MVLCLYAGGPYRQRLRKKEELSNHCQEDLFNGEATAVAIISAVPEPSSLLLAGTGVFLMIAHAWWRGKLESEMY